MSAGHLAGSDVAASPASGEDVALRLEVCLAKYLSPITARSVLAFVCRKLGVDRDGLGREPSVLARVLDDALSLYLTDHDKVRALAAIDASFGRGVESAPGADTSTAVIDVAREADVATARSAALHAALGAGLPKADAVKVSTVTSELARNIVQYAGSGRIEIRVAAGSLAAVEVIASDHGPGITNIDEILAGKYRSRTGMGLGLTGSKRMMDEFHVHTRPGQGTTIKAVKYR